MSKDKFDLDFRPGYIAVGKIFQLGAELPYGRAVLFHCTQFFVVIFCLGTLANTLLKNTYLAILFQVLCTLFLFQTLFKQFGIDSYVFLQSVVVLWLGYKLTADKQIPRRTLLALFILYSLITPIIASLSKPLVIFMYLGFLCYEGSSMLLLAWQTRRISKKKFIRFILFSVPIIIIFGLMNVIATEREAVSFSSVMLQYFLNILSGSNILNVITSPFISFASVEIHDLFGNIFVFILPFIILLILGIPLRFKGQLLFWSLCLSQIPLIIILGLTGLRSGQAATVLLLWLFAILIVMKLMARLFQSRAERPIISIFLTTSLCFFGLVKWSDNIEWRDIDYRNLSTETNEKNLALATLFLPKETGNAYHDYAWSPKVKFLKRNILNTEKGNRLQPIYLSASYDLLTRPIELDLKAGDVIFHRWVRDYYRNTPVHKNLLFVRDKTPRLKLFIVRFCRPEKPIEKGDSLHITNRWKAAVTPVLDSLFEYSEKSGTFTIEESFCSMADYIYVHPNLHGVITQNQSDYTFGSLNAVIDSPTKELRSKNGLSQIYYLLDAP